MKPVVPSGAPCFTPAQSPLFRPSHPSRTLRLDRHYVPFYGARC